MNDTLEPDLRALAAIDPAGARDPQAHLSSAAAGLLASIITAPDRPVRPIAADSSGAPTELGAKGRTRRRVWVLAGAAAVVAGGLVVLPNVAPGGGAYASWTDVPAAATGSNAAAAEDECRDMWLDFAATPGEGIPERQVVADADLVLAEQRGDFTYTVLSDGAWGMDCLVQTERGVWWSGGVVGAGGSLQPLGDSGELAPDGVADLMLVGAFGPDIDGLVLTLYARVGAEVTAAVVHTPEVGDVEATVTNGYLAAWAPGLPDDALDVPSIGMTLYLADGSQIELTPEDVDALATANTGA